MILPFLENQRIVWMGGYRAQKFVILTIWMAGDVSKIQVSKIFRESGKNDYRKTCNTTRG